MINNVKEIEINLKVGEDWRTLTLKFVHVSCSFFHNHEFLGDEIKLNERRMDGWITK